VDLASNLEIIPSFPIIFNASHRSGLLLPFTTSSLCLSPTISSIPASETFTGAAKYTLSDHDALFLFNSLSLIFEGNKPSGNAPITAALRLKFEEQNRIPAIPILTPATSARISAGAISPVGSLYTSGFPPT
jgi:hypothetical protein